jgi:6-phosphogluconolactonase (cycloisomerase 2 family)
VTVDPNGQYVYVANFGNSGSNGTVSAYSIDSTTGGLTKINNGDISAGINPRSGTVDPNGQYVYVANQGNSVSNGTVSAYSILGSGALTPITQTNGCTISDISAGINPSSVTVDPNGQFVYVANAKDGSIGSISAYSINLTTGALTKIHMINTSNEIQAGIKPMSVTVDPTGQYVYVANQGDGVSVGTVSAYSILGSGGLSPIMFNNSTNQIAAGIDPSSLITVRKQIN